MSLQSRLDALKEKFVSSAPKDALEVMHRATEDLKQSGILDGILKTGDRLPDFSLTSPDGAMVHSTDILSKNAAILTFYRGKW